MPSTATPADLFHVVPTAQAPKDAVAAVEHALTERKFTTLFKIDMKATLTAKGFPTSAEAHIMEVCNAGQARTAIETNSDIAAFLPCKIVVAAAEDGKTVIKLPRPTRMLGVLGDDRLTALAEEVEATLTDAVNAAAKAGASSAAAAPTAAA